MPQLKQLMFKWLLGWWLIILCLRYYIATFQDIWHRLIPGDSIPRTRWSTMCMGCFNFHNLLSRCSYRINYGMKNMARRTIFLGTLPMMTSWYGNSFHLRGEFTQSPVDFLHKGTVIRRFDVAFIVSLNQPWNKQSSCHLYKTPCLFGDAMGV